MTQAEDRTGVVQGRRALHSSGASAGGDDPRGSRGATGGGTGCPPHARWAGGPAVESGRAGGARADMCGAGRPARRNDGGQGRKWTQRPRYGAVDRDGPSGTREDRGGAPGPPDPGRRGVPRGRVRHPGSHSGSRGQYGMMDVLTLTCGPERPLSRPGPGREDGDWRERKACAFPFPGRVRRGSGGRRPLARLSSVILCPLGLDVAFHRRQRSPARTLDRVGRVAKAG